MTSWMDRSAREWAVGGASGPGGASTAALAGLLGATRLVVAIEAGDGGAGGLGAIVADLTRLPERIDAAASAIAAAPEPTARASARRAAAGELLAAFDACFALLEIAQTSVANVPDDRLDDLWVGADLAAAAVEALAICVRRALPAIPDEAFTRPLRAHLVDALHETRRARERVLQAVESRIEL